MGGNTDDDMRGRRHWPQNTGVAIIGSGNALCVTVAVRGILWHALLCLFIAPAKRRAYLLPRPTGPLPIDVSSLRSVIPFTGLPSASTAVVPYRTNPAAPGTVDSTLRQGTARLSIVPVAARASVSAPRPPQRATAKRGRMSLRNLLGDLPSSNLLTKVSAGASIIHAPTVEYVSTISDHEAPQSPSSASPARPNVSPSGASAGASGSAGAGAAGPLTGAEPPTHRGKIAACAVPVPATHARSSMRSRSPARRAAAEARQSGGGPEDGDADEAATGLTRAILYVYSVCAVPTGGSRARPRGACCGGWAGPEGAPLRCPPPCPIDRRPAPGSWYPSPGLCALPQARLGRAAPRASCLRGPQPAAGDDERIRKNDCHRTLTPPHQSPGSRCPSHRRP